MATTDARTGFRLPWSSDQRPATDESGTPDRTDAASDDGWGAARQVAQAAGEDTSTATVDGDHGADASGGGTNGGRRPTKFLADLTRAMQTTAEAAREDTLGRLQADAKAHIEEIHARAATESNDLRRRADDDVAAVREWSKAEIARIREETETRIADRKTRLEGEIEDHAALIERQIARVQSRVTSFEAEMADFFERLLAEEDPTRFASMAENLPEPPPFEFDDIAVPLGGLREERAVAASAPAEAAAPVREAATEDGGFETSAHDDAWSGTGSVAESREAAMAAIQAAAEAAVTDEEQPAAPTQTDTDLSPWRDLPSADAGWSGEGEPTESPTTGEGADAPNDAAIDARLAAFGGASGFAEAEAEALVAADNTDAAEEIEIPTIADEALAARLAGLVPGADDDGALAQLTTQVVVNGLVSVASIASFKRHLGRVSGVQAVGVSSGPDGEFVFAVTHGPEVDLRESVPALPGFGARVTGGSDGVVEVSARDPESEG